MKTLLLAAVLIVSASCGKNEKKKNEWRLNPYEVNPVTGEVSIVRAVVPPTRVYVNELDRVIHILETQSKYEHYQGFSCFGELRSGMSRYELSHDGRQLTLFSRLGNEVYHRQQSAQTLIGSTWTRSLNNRLRNASVVKLTFVDQNTAHMVVECPTR